MVCLDVLQLMVVIDEDEVYLLSAQKKIVDTHVHCLHPLCYYPQDVENLVQVVSRHQNYLKHLVLKFDCTAEELLER